MARIKPFKGVRPPKDLIEQVASRPYDVLNSEEAREEAKGNEKSLYHIIKPEIDFPVGTDEHDPAVYLKAAANFRMFQEKGWLVQDKEECYYVYAQTMNGKTQYGLVVGAYVPDYMNGVIKKHELTRRDKEEDRMKHVRVNNANIEPVFFAYPDNAELDQIVAKYTSRNPEYDFVAKDDGFGHTFWIIDEPADIARITDAVILRIGSCILPTAITVPPPPPWSVRRKPDRTRLIKGTRSITTLWLSVSRQTS